MSVIGKGASSLRKKDVQEQKSIALGFKKIRFAHKATAGDTGINITSLVQPTEMAAYGFVNPSVAELGRVQINLFRNNLKLVSSLRGVLIDQLSYVVGSSTQINFLDFTAEDGEIFTGWLDEVATTDLQVVDGKSIVATGPLAASTTDFNVGMPFEINKNSAQQIGAVMVYRNGLIQARCEGNVLTGTGDYIEVPVAGGLGSLIRFKVAPIGGPDAIIVVSNGVIAERPDGSMTAMIERVQGQIDQMVPTLAAVAGVPESTFQLAPNDIDLKQFGDTVIDQQNTLDDHEARIDALEVATYIEGIAGFTTTVGAADTWTDVASSTINLPPGQWELVYNGMTYVDNISGGSLTVFGNLAITDSSNIIQDKAILFIGGALASGNPWPQLAHLVARVPGGTYKLRIRCNFAAASARMSAGDLSSFTAGLTDPDSGAKWYARKVGL